MTFRRRRPDDWATSHARARVALSDRLDGVLEPSESGWLDDHLASCEECRAIAGEYETQRIQLRAAREDAPTPPRDLWARTAAAIELDSSFRDRRARRAGLPRPWLRSPLLAAALVAAVAVGTLFSSQLAPGGGTTAPSAAATAAATTGIAASQQAEGTPIPVGEHVQWISRDANGRYRLTNWDVQSVCPSPGDGCTSTPPVQDQPVGIETEPQSVFGSRDGKQLIVVNQPDQTNPGVSVVSLESPPVANPTPSATATSTPSTTPTVTASAGSTPPSATPTASARASVRATATPSVPATATPSGSSAAPPTPSVAVTPSATPGGPIQIAQDVVLVGQSAAYSPNNEWFAFTARPADGKTGPDIYLWHVGQPVARPATTDHHSTFGSWTADNRAVGSSVIEATNDNASAAPDLDTISFVLDPTTGEEVVVPQAGRAWRPSVDPTGHRAIYWAGTLRRQSDPPRYLPFAGRLVLGDWDAGAATADGSAAPTPLKSDQAGQRHETTIVAGQIQDWDARWDSTGTKVAVWIADANDPTVGSLSLYSVDTFDGRIDLKKPLLDSTRASAGFSMSDGKLAWAEPDGTAGVGRVLVLAWTDHGAGTVETASDQVVVIR
jgi:hypothetical protein